MTKEEDELLLAKLDPIVRRLKDMMSSAKSRPSTLGPGRKSRLAIRLYDQEFEKIEAAATARGLSMSDYLRERIDLPTKGAPPAPTEGKSPGRRGPRRAGARVKRRR